MPYFGDIFIPILTDKDTSISKDVVEKNFVDKLPQVYELTPDLEAGTYTALLNETYNDKNETFEEQQDAVLSMISRHGTEFPFQVGGDVGYSLVESGSITVSPSLEIREAEIQVRFLDEVDYNPAVKTYAGSSDGDYTVDPVESVVAFPSDVTVSGYTPAYQISSEDGNIDLYLFSGGEIFDYSEVDSDHTLSQSHSICRLFDSTGDRIYSQDESIDVDSEIDNSVVRVGYGSTSSSLEYYNGASWVNIGQTNLGFDDGYAPENTNDKIEVEFVNGNRSSVYRGFSIAGYTFTGETSFSFTPANTYTEQSVNSYYSHYQDGNGNDIVLVRKSSDGSFFDDATNIGVQTLDSTKEYTVYVGVVPSAVTVSDYARFVYNFGSRIRTFVQ